MLAAVSMVVLCYNGSLQHSRLTLPQQHPITNQQQIKHRKRIALHHPHGSLFYHLYYIYMWYVFYLRFICRPGELSDNTHTQFIVQYTHAAMFQQQHQHITSK